MADRPSARSSGSFARNFAALVENAERVVRGKPEAIARAFTGLVAGGHLLIEDVPGLGKTSLARCVAASVSGSFHRIQFTPDLLPSDVTGVTVYNQADASFSFHPGPVFAHVVLADEVNRASPKTQSALLEVMSEGQVTVDGEPHPVPRPFFVVATQNPIDMDGTYALPEAQLDRFLMRIRVGYPDRAAEMEILDDGRSDRASVEDLRPVLSTDDVEAMTSYANGLYVAAGIRGYVVDLVDATRHHPSLRLGSSPRGSIALLRAAKVRAAADERNFVQPEDIKDLAVDVLAHRVILAPDAELRGDTTEETIAEVLESVPVPRTVVGA